MYKRQAVLKRLELSTKSVNELVNTFENDTIRSVLNVDTRVDTRTSTV